MDKYRKVLLPSLQNLDIIHLEGFCIPIGEWLLTKEEIQPCFLIHTTQESILGILFGLLFFQISINNWIPFDFIKRQVPHPSFYTLRVYIKSNSMRQIINFNPINIPNLTIYSIWLYKKGFIYNFDFDPKEQN